MGKSMLIGHCQKCGREFRIKADYCDDCGTYNQAPTPAASPWCYDMDEAPKNKPLILLTPERSVESVTWLATSPRSLYVAWAAINLPEQGNIPEVE